MDNITLTPRQQQVLDIIRSHIQVHGHPPTRAEIARAIGARSANAAEDHLRALARKGVLELRQGVSRGILLCEPDDENEFEEHLRLPLIGQVAAGSPILAQENIAATHSLPLGLFSPKADYLLRVSGMSMRDAGIMEGDLLAVYRTTEVRVGQIIVARLGDEVTVKRFYRQGHHVTLQAHNPDFQDIELDLRQDELVVEGRVVGVIRTGVS